jgi:hypothetical protein
MQDQTLPVVKPAAIRRAIGLFWGSLAIGVVKTPRDWAYLTSRASTTGVGCHQVLGEPRVAVEFVLERLNPPV